MTARIHPTALVEEDVTIGDGSAIWDNVHIRHGATIGHDCIVGEKSYIAYDVVIGDAFGGRAVPWHLTTTEVVGEIDRMLRPEGIYVMNVIDGGDSRFARAQLATLAEHFEHVVDRLVLAQPRPDDGPKPAPVRFPHGSPVGRRPADLGGRLVT